MTEYDEFPGIVTDSETEQMVGLNAIAETHERELQRVYKMGILHGINAQSMAQVKEDVMTFDDYGWDVDD